MNCGVIYIKVLVPKGHPSEWIRYCYIFSMLPKSLQENIKHIANDINTKYSEDIIIPMDIHLHPGCVTKPELVESVATDMYNQFLELCVRQGFPDCVRCVYSIGVLSDIEYDSLHHVAHIDQRSGPGGSDEIMIKLGRYLDEYNDSGLFRI